MAHRPYEVPGRPSKKQQQEQAKRNAAPQCRTTIPHGAAKARALVNNLFAAASKKALPEEEQKIIVRTLREIANEVPPKKTIREALSFVLKTAFERGYISKESSEKHSKTVCGNAIGVNSDNRISVDDLIKALYPDAEEVYIEKPYIFASLAKAGLAGLELIKKAIIKYCEEHNIDYDDHFTFAKSIENFDSTLELLIKHYFKRSELLKGLPDLKVKILGLEMAFEAKIPEETYINAIYDIIYNHVYSIDEDDSHKAGPALKK